MKKTTTKEHIEKVGKAVFNRAVSAAILSIRQDTRLIGLDKIRGELAEEAALRATGFKVRPFTPSKNCGIPESGIMEICAKVLDRATDAAKLVHAKP